MIMTMTMIMIMIIIIIIISNDNNFILKALSPLEPTRISYGFCENFFRLMLFLENVLVIPVVDFFFYVPIFSNKINT